MPVKKCWSGFLGINSKFELYVNRIAITKLSSHLPEEGRYFRIFYEDTTVLMKFRSVMLPIGS